MNNLPNKTEQNFCQFEKKPWRDGDYGPTLYVRLIYTLVEGPKLDNNQSGFIYSRVMCVSNDTNWGFLIIYLSLFLHICLWDTFAVIFDGNILQSRSLLVYFIYVHRSDEFFCVICVLKAPTTHYHIFVYYKCIGSTLLVDIWIMCLYNLYTVGGGLNAHVCVCAIWTVNIHIITFTLCRLRVSRLDASGNVFIFWWQPHSVESFWTVERERERRMGGGRFSCNVISGPNTSSQAGSDSRQTGYQPTKPSAQGAYVRSHIA